MGKLLLTEALICCSLCFGMLLLPSMQYATQYGVGHSDFIRLLPFYYLQTALLLYTNFVLPLDVISLK